MTRPLLYLEIIPKHIPYVNGFDAETIQPYLLPMDDPRGFYGLFNDIDTVFEKTYTIPEKDPFYYPIIISLWQFQEIVDKVQIPAAIIDRVNKGQCKILLVGPYEGWLWDYWNNLADVIREKYVLQHGNFVMLTGGYYPNPKYTSVTFNYWENSSYQWAGGDCQRTQGIDNLPRIRKNKFICLNRRPAPHRFAAVTLLNDLKDQGILTCAKTAGYQAEHINFQQVCFSEYYPDLIDQFNNDVLPNIPMVYHDGMDPETQNPAVDYNTDKFYDSYLYIVTETYFHEKETLFLSEKIFKPILFYQPFVVIGRPGTLKLLHQLGYKTFSDYFDESYDEEEDDHKRMIKAINTARSLINMSPEELTALMIKMEAVLYHNYLIIQERSRNLFTNLTADLVTALK